MVDRFKKKIINILNQTYSFFKNHLAEIILLVFIFQLLMTLKQMPYFNIINNFEYYSITFVLFLAVLFFRVVVPNIVFKKLLLILIVIAAIFTITELTAASTFFGFLIYILLLIIILRELRHNRKELKDEDV